MRTLGILIALLMIGATVLAGCLTLPEEEPDAPEPGPTLGPNETDDRTQPAAGNNKLYFHGTGPDDVWMSTDANESSTTLTATFTAGSDDYVVAFELTPTPIRTINFTDGELTACLELSMTTLGMGVSHTVELLVDGERVTSATSPTQTINGRHCLPMNEPEPIAAGSDVVLQLTVSPEPTTINAQWEMAVDGSSYLTMPIETPVYVDLNATDDGQTPTRRADGDVRTYQQGGTWYAEQVITFTGGIGSANTLDVDLSTGSGAVDAAPRSDTNYRIVLDLKGHGDSEEEARQKLDEIRVDHSDDVDAGTMTLRTRATTPDNTWNNQSAHIDAEIPTQVTLGDFAADTGSGPVDVTGLTGETIALDTGSGPVSLDDLMFDDVSVSTGSGPISATGSSFGDAALATGSGSISIDGGSYQAASLETGSGPLDIEDGAEFGDLRGSTGSGPISVEATPTGGAWGFETGSGQIEVTVPDSAAYGYDAQGRTTQYAGTVTIDLADTEPVGQQESHSKHERTTDYDQRDVRTTLEAETASGDVDIVGD